MHLNSVIPVNSLFCKLIIYKTDGYPLVRDLEFKIMLRIGTNYAYNHSFIIKAGL